MDLTTIIFLIPVAIAGAIATARWPAATVIFVFVLTGFQLTVSAYLALPPAGVADVLLLALWLGVVGTYVRQSNERPFWLWVGLAAPAVYLALTFISIFASDSFSNAIESFRLTGFHMASIFLLALAPWPPGTHMRIARGLVGVALLVGLYAILRKIIGSSGSEEVVHQASLGQQGVTEGPQFNASFYTAQDLAGWCGMITPFALAMTLAWRGPWRIVAALAGITSAFALLAADKRAAVIGAAAGSVLVIVLFLLAARPFGARRLGVAFLAVTLSVAVGIGVYTVTIARSPETLERFESLITAPSEDYTFRLRLARWEKAVDTASEEFLGHGLGTVGEIGEARRDKAAIAPFLDSSYLKIAIEQGWPMLVVFAIAMLWLILALAARGVAAPRPESAALAMGACGAIVTMLVLFFSSFFIERLTTLAGWLIVGLAAAQFTGAGQPAPPSPPAARRRPVRSPLLRPPEPGAGLRRPERPLARTG